MSNEFIMLIGASSLLLFSMDQLSRTFQYLAGDRFRLWINLFARNRFTGALLGVVLSFIMSSSGAVTVMLVGLANSRLLNLKQILSVTLGAAVGSTVIVQLVAFRISQYSYLLIALAVFITMITDSNKSRRIGKGILYAGLMFLSLDVIVTSSSGLKNNELFVYVVNYFRDEHIYSFVIAAILTAILHSSAAVIAIFISLMPAMDLTIREAVPYILGANLGTTATAFLASLQGEAHGKQAALGNLFLRLGGIILIYPLVDQLADLSLLSANDPGRQAANAHTFFNIFIAVSFFPFIEVGARLINRFVKDSGTEKAFTYSFIDSRSLDTPELALAQAQREILRLSDTVEQMVGGCLEVFQNPDKEKMDTIRAKDRIVDFLNKGIRLFLTNITQSEMTEEQVHKEFELFLRTNDLESIGDIVDKNIIGLAKKNAKKGYIFSDAGWEDIQDFHKKTMKCLELSNAYFMSNDPGLGVRLTLLQDELDELIIELTEQHIMRLHQGVKEAVQTTSVHLDLLGYLHNIANISVQYLKFRESKA